MNRFLQHLGLLMALFGVGGLPASAQSLSSMGGSSLTPLLQTKQETPVLQETLIPQETPIPEEDDYTRFMRIGYGATEQFDYHTALINFRRALEARPEDPFAMVAIENVEYYIERDRANQRQQEIDRLEERLNLASEKKDWVCAAATVDELITYTEANSLNRQRLLGYRGELSGLLSARTDLEAWSTVCTPNRPLL